jgi:hypothetical protein
MSCEHVPGFTFLALIEKVQLHVLQRTALVEGRYHFFRSCDLILLNRVAHLGFNCRGYLDKSVKKNDNLVGVFKNG